MEPDCPICRTGLIGSASVCTCAWWTLLVARLPELYCFGLWWGLMQSPIRLDAETGLGAVGTDWLMMPDSAMEPDTWDGGPILHWSPIARFNTARFSPIHYQGPRKPILTGTGGRILLNCCVQDKQLRREAYAALRRDGARAGVIEQSVRDALLLKKTSPVIWPWAWCAHENRIPTSMDRPLTKPCPPSRL